MAHRLYKTMRDGLSALEQGFHKHIKVTVRDEIYKPFDLEQMAEYVGLIRAAFAYADTFQMTTDGESVFGIFEPEVQEGVELNAAQFARDIGNLKTFYRDRYDAVICNYRANRTDDFLVRLRESLQSGEYPAEKAARYSQAIKAAVECHYFHIPLLTLNPDDDDESEIRRWYEQKLQLAGELYRDICGVAFPFPPTAYPIPHYTHQDVKNAFNDTDEKRVAKEKAEAAAQREREAAEVDALVQRELEAAQAEQRKIEEEVERMKEEARKMQEQALLDAGLNPKDFGL